MIVKSLIPVVLLFLSLQLNAQQDIKRSDHHIWGIDISHHQGEVDWRFVTKDKPHFIFLKATEGITIIDKKYHQNYRDARENGILTGSYHFFSYKSSGIRQALHFLSVVKYQKGDLPLVLDAEFGKHMPPDRIVTKELVDFIETVTRVTGDKLLIYCQDRFYSRFLKHDLRNPQHLWICDFVGKPDMDHWVFWQQTDKFYLSGIHGKVDFNVFNGDMDKLRSLRKI